MGGSFCMNLHIGVLAPYGEEGSRISAMLRDGGYRVSQSEALASLSAAGETDPYDMTILVTGPSPTGTAGISEDVARDIRAASEFGIPLLVVAQAMDEAAVIRALRLGADGCVCPPFGQAEFLARVEAHLRRHWQWGLAQRPGPPEEVLVDALSCAAVVDGREVRLTPTEYRLLSKLAESEGNVVSNDELRSHIWGLDQAASPGSLRLYISHLRKKLEADPHKPRLIRTKWGVGYYLQGKTVTV